ncbi:Holliday junction branch migration protein RuvA [Rhodoluna limnophila]|uniref:Holliday junction branch migration protein RuvA n=1 Tax=Rhodoluna limnophila TaxID=232537 RepID=UPI00110597DF|nr:Holliday junction branch migration protein RuvA [Rhodoluna limnophila]
MIASLRGICRFLNLNQCVVDVTGVGYLVAITPNTSVSLSEGAEVEFLTSMIVREDAMQLFGFLTEEERSTFELLRSVSGVGPKSALAVLSGLSVNKIAESVASQNDSTFRAISGIGPKTAKLICISLAGKIGVTSTNEGEKTTIRSTDVVLEALIGLGWTNKLAEVSVKRVLNDAPDLSDAGLLKAALADLGKGKSVGA